jgi:hypothetical protein
MKQRQLVPQGIHISIANISHIHTYIDTETGLAAIKQPIENI